MSESASASGTELGDYSQRSLKEVMALQLQNRTAACETRLKLKLLVEARLAKQITIEEFRAERLAAIGLQAVIHRRHLDLATEIRQLGLALKLNPFQADLN